jgi:two-component system response regulator AtoC
MDRLINYTWPGNIRELENMTKRFVVLQDEALILGELARVEAAAPLRDAPRGGETVPALRTASAPLILANTPTTPAEPVVPTAAPADPEDATGVDLQALAKAAAMSAERAAIQAALARFRWNRRKAAEYLNVSYKTLLNKMRESRISETET